MCPFIVEIVKMTYILKIENTVGMMENDVRTKCFCDSHITLPEIEVRKLGGQLKQHLAVCLVVTLN